MSPACSSGVVDPSRPGQDLGQPEDRRDRGPQLVRDDVDERLAECAGPALVVEQLVALGLEAATLGDVRPGADHADRARRRRRGRRGRRRGSSGSEPSGQRSRNSRLNDGPAASAAVDRRPERRAVVGVDRRRRSARSWVARPSGSRPCCEKIASDQVSAPVRTSHSQNPVPDAARTSSRRSSRRSMSAAMAPTSASERARRSRDVRSEAIRAVTTAPPAMYRTSPCRGRARSASIDGAVRARRRSTVFRMPATSVAVSPPGNPPIQAARATAPVRRMKPGLPAERRVESRLDHDRGRGRWRRRGRPPGRARGASRRAGAGPRWHGAAPARAVRVKSRGSCSWCGQRRVLRAMDPRVVDTTRLVRDATDMRLRCARHAAAVRSDDADRSRTSVGRAVPPWPYHLSRYPA